PRRWRVDVVRELNGSRSWERAVRRDGVCAETPPARKTRADYEERSLNMVVRRAVAVGVVGLLLLAALLYSQSRPEPFRVSGFIEADEIRVGSRVGGRVQRVHVEEGQRVAPGDLLVELEPFRLKQRQAEAAAQLAALEAEYNRLLAGYRAEEKAQAIARVEQLQAVLERLRSGPRPQEIAAAREEVEQAQAQLEFAQSQYRRLEVLIGRQAASQEELDEARSRMRVASATLELRREQLALLEAGTRAEEIAEAEARLKEAQAAAELIERGYRPEEIAHARAAEPAAEANLPAIEQRLAELRVGAPVAGIVQAIELQPGDLLGANVPAPALLDVANLWVRAYVPENRLSIQTGQVVWV